MTLLVLKTNPNEIKATKKPLNPKVKGNSLQDITVKGLILQAVFRPNSLSLHWGCAFLDHVLSCFEEQRVSSALHEKGKTSLPELLVWLYKRSKHYLTIHCFQVSA